MVFFSSLFCRKVSGELTVAETDVNTPVTSVTTITMEEWMLHLMYVFQKFLLITLFCQTCMPAAGLLQLDEQAQVPLVVSLWIKGLKWHLYFLMEASNDYNFKYWQISSFSHFDNVLKIKQFKIKQIEVFICVYVMSPAGTKKKNKCKYKWAETCCT